MFKLPETEQEVFERVAKHLLAQGKKSVDLTRNSCAYKTSDGLICAAGCLIPNEIYNESFEGHTWDELILFHNFPSEHQKFISTLQDMHDWADTNTWKDRLIEIAKGQNLDPSFLQGI